MLAAGSLILSVPFQRGFTWLGVVDIPPQQETVYRWGDAAADYAPQSDVWLMIFERARPQ